MACSFIHCWHLSISVLHLSIRKWERFVKTVWFLGSQVSNDKHVYIYIYMIMLQCKFLNVYRRPWLKKMAIMLMLNASLYWHRLHAGVKSPMNLLCVSNTLYLIAWSSWYGIRADSPHDPNSLPPIRLSDSVSHKKSYHKILQNFNKLDLSLELCICSEIWQVAQQLCCWPEPPAKFQSDTNTISRV